MMKSLRLLGLATVTALAFSGVELTGADAASRHRTFDLPSVGEFVAENGLSTVRSLNPDLTATDVAELSEDPTARMTDHGFVVFVEPARTALPLLTPTATRATPNIPLANFDSLNSRPESTRTIFLDFDGHTVPAGTIWDDPSQQNPLVAGEYPAFDVNNNPAFNDAEKQIIIDTWAAVAEDYAPFDVNVTTSDPGDDAIERTNFADVEFGTRALITAGNASWNSSTCECGGIAYLDVFNASVDTIGYPHWALQPAFVFAGQGYDGKIVSDIASHEVGHNLNLDHDGSASDGAYFQGRYDGKNWAPIMGAGYYNGIVQWSNGDYPNSSNPENDTALIAAAGVPLLPDGANNAIATALPISATPTAGIIGTRTDVDWFKATVTTGTLGVYSSSPTLDSNLDTKLTLLDASGVAILSTDELSGMTEDSYGEGAWPATGLAGVLNIALPNGTYYVTLEGVGRTGAYSDYGSLGRYSVVTRAISQSAIVTAPNPTISGTKRKGRTLTVNRGTWTAGTTLSQQWMRNGVPISGATGTTYVLKTADVGKRITVRVLGQKAGKASVLRVSARTSVISN